MLAADLDALHSAIVALVDPGTSLGGGAKLRGAAQQVQPRHGPDQWRRQTASDCRRPPNGTIRGPSGYGLAVDGMRLPSIGTATRPLVGR